MAKRFTDTDKWNKEWYRKLGSRLRDIRQYVLDKCDHAGIWEADLETLAYFTGHEVSLSDISAAFKDEVFDLGGAKFFFPAFIEFQYGELSPDSKPHQSVIKTLAKYGIDPKNLNPSNSSPKGFYTLKEKEEEKEKNKEKEKESEKNNLEISGALALVPEQVPTNSPVGNHVELFQKRYCSNADFVVLTNWLEGSSLKKQLHKFRERILDHYGTPESFEQAIQSIASAYEHGPPKNCSRDQYIVLTVKKALREE